MTHALIVLAHPLPESFAHAAAARIRAALAARGCTTDLLDLYAEGFDPRMSAGERASFFDVPYAVPADIAPLTARLEAADELVFVFPQWWFNMPAVLKGFFDRVFAPGIAYVHALDLGTIKPRLTRVQRFSVVTSTGSPWWAARLYMGDPVRRLLKRAIMAYCCPNARFRMFSLHDMDRMTPRKAERFLARLDRAFS